MLNMYTFNNFLMKKIGIFYGSNTGTTEAIAGRLAKLFGVGEADVHDIATVAPSRFGDYDVLVLGTSTWGAGDLQEDWYDFVDGADALDLAGKKIALFGCGDETMTDTFCSGVGKLYERFKPTGATFVGEFDADGYTFNHSGAYIDGAYIGLLLDEVNHPELTDLRIRIWVTEVMSQIDK